MWCEFGAVAGKKRKTAAVRTLLMYRKNLATLIDESVRTPSLRPVGGVVGPDWHHPG